MCREVTFNIPGYHPAVLLSSIQFLSAAILFLGTLLMKNGGGIGWSTPKPVQSAPMDLLRNGSITLLRETKTYKSSPASYKLMRPSRVMAAKTFRTNLSAFTSGKVVSATISLDIDNNSLSLNTDLKVNNNGGGIESGGKPNRSIQSSVADGKQESEERCSCASVSNNLLSKASRKQKLGSSVSQVASQ